jgi:hypothetical protein
MSGHKKKASDRRWRKLYNKEYHNLYASPDNTRLVKSGMMTRAGHVACIGQMRNAYKVLVGKPESKRPLGRTRRKWAYNIRTGLREIEWRGENWIHLTQEMDQWRALANAVMNLRVP